MATEPHNATPAAKELAAGACIGCFALFVIGVLLFIWTFVYGPSFAIYGGTVQRAGPETRRRST
jgi:hypothetical protein